MEIEELLRIMTHGEDSKHQFKANVTRSESLAQEMVAFSNSQGGIVLIGVSDHGAISGLTSDDMGRINQLVSNAATEHMRPPISPITQNLSLPDGMVMVVFVPKGISKPYMDKSLHVYVKSGADKRKVTAREELQRMFQAAALVHADQIPVNASSVDDVDSDFFDAFFEREFPELDVENISRAQLLENMNLLHRGQLNICGALLFAKKPQNRLPAFIVKAVSFPGVDIEDEQYLDSQDITGKLSDIYQKVRGFVLANIRHQQNDRGFNSLGEPEIPHIVLEELLVNALIHRDYFVSAPVKVFVFADRIEIISPGHLPNSLTIENVKMGNSNFRNPILASFAARILPYRGIGSGIRRAIKAYSKIEFIDERDANTFKVIIWRSKVTQ